MRGCWIAFVAFLPMVFSDEDELCHSHGNVVSCHCTESLPEYDWIFLSASENTTKLEFSSCSFASLGYPYLGGALSLEIAIFRNINELSLQLQFPPKLTELRLNGVKLEPIDGAIFSGDTRLQHLHVQNSTFVHIKRNTFVGVTVENALFEHVNFEGLEEDSLVFSFGGDTEVEDASRRDFSVISFRGCRFPDIDFSPISVAAPGKIKFVDNLLNCTSLARVYTWMEAILVSQHGNDKLLCQYLDENFCETKRDGNKLIRRIFDTDVLSHDVGLKLEQACPGMYKEFLAEKKMASSAREGRVLNAGLLFLVFCLAAITLEG